MLTLVLSVMHYIVSADRKRELWGTSDCEPIGGGRLKWVNRFVEFQSAVRDAFTEDAVLKAADQEIKLEHEKLNRAMKEAPKLMELLCGMVEHYRGQLELIHKDPVKIVRKKEEIWRKIITGDSPEHKLTAGQQKGALALVGWWSWSAEECPCILDFLSAYKSQIMTKYKDVHNIDELVKGLKYCVESEIGTKWVDSSD